MKNEKGLTLIALVITIIVMIILAGVSLSLTTGDNGVLNKAKLAREETRAGQIRDIRDMYLADRQIAVEIGEKPEALDDVVDRLKEDGLLTQAEVDEIMTKEEIKIGTQIISFKDNNDYTDNELNQDDDSILYAKEIKDTLYYFTFDETTGTLTSKEERIGTYENRTFPLKVVVFPKEINGVKVKTIKSHDGTGIFSASSSQASALELEKVIILSEITNIEDWAFLRCTKLSNIEIPNSVKRIGELAFEYCRSLENITIPNSVTNIDACAFFGCTGLTSVEIPNSVTNIGAKAFESCTNLTSIEIPSSVKNIGEQAFGYCTNLKNVYYTGTEEEWNAITKGSYNEALINATITYNYGK